MSFASFFDEKLIYTHGFHLQLFTTILTDELFAIYSALNYAVERNRNDLLLIVSDTLFYIQRLKNCLLFRNNPYLIFEILNTLTASSTFYLSFKLMSIPAHNNIQGNEYIDAVCREINNSSNNRIYFKLSLKGMRMSQFS